MTKQVHGVYFLSEFSRMCLERNGEWSACSEPRKDDEHFALYNKNGFKTLHVKNLGQCPDRHGWFVQCDDVPEYFRNVLKPVVERDDL